MRFFGDQDGNEAQDVLYGVSAAIRRYLWIDRERMGVEGVSYGGQLSDWRITQTNEFKAAIPTAGISNLISYNYMTYYNQYEEMEFGQFLHQGRLMDLAWERSALKHVASVHTPTLLIHGENDPDVPIAEAEQYFIALKDVGVDTVFVRYPREGHGLRETKLLWIGLIFQSPGMKNTFRKRGRKKSQTRSRSCESEIVQNGATVPSVILRFVRSRQKAGPCSTESRVENADCETSYPY